jgi:hypothetical protein
MWKLNRRTIFVWAIALFAAAMPIGASDPIGIYGIVKKVVFEPNEAAPQAVQIWGAFALAVPRSPNGIDRQRPEGSFGTDQAGDVYAPVQAGYLYFSCPALKATACANEWSDLKKAAGTGEILGFGGRYQPLGTVRKADAPPAKPDAYPLNVGVVKFGRFSANPDLVTALKVAAAK